MIIWHNSRCGKSREALNLLIQKGYKISVREYLKEPPTVKELKAVIKKLNCKATDIIRKKENLYQEKFSALSLSNNGCIKVLCENPILIERPIVITEHKAIVARPHELLYEFLKTAD
jgi:arsenate reductase